MLIRPSSCEGCPLHPIATGFMQPQLATHPYGVTLLGEALGEDEAEAGRPFVGKAGFKLSRLIEWAGLDRSRFDILNAAWCQPPGNKLEGTPFEYSAISHCRQSHWDHLLSRSTVVVPMGNVPTNVLTGFKNILTNRGYVSSGPRGNYIIPTVHPAFIARGNSKWSAAFINDLQKAVELAQRGLPPQILDYLLDPSPMVAYEWATGYLSALARDSSIKLAFDIETPGKGEDEDELDLDGLADKTFHIFRIGFSYKGLSALSVPWEPAFIPTIKRIMGSSGPKVVWNAGFDVPRVRRAGVAINGTIHDGMVAWHILHSDLPKKLAFVATFTCPWQPAWKHLSGAKPAFYNATDADVEWRAMEVIESELKRVGLWDVYQRDVLDLEPVLQWMSEKGMRIDPEVREVSAKKLADRQAEVHSAMESVVPMEARKIEHVYVKPPKDISGLLVRPGTREVAVCSGCGLQAPRKDHFKSYVKKVNPCSSQGPVKRNVEVQEYYRLADFTPSRDQLIRYHRALSRPLPMIWDKKAKVKKVSFNEEQIKKLILAYPLDILYPKVLEYRSLDKLAGTYIGRPVG
jgi:uracil-DNA glycosylase family 4